ncbi:hypothetical protein BDI24065_06341 [Burkholderia diffusa]|uniref:Uncharacterized protein n=2 Tax=Burkholderia diffusa TaxID=488732 RepID=A0A6P2RDB9_9BURK|nr:hypothetical protein BDI24065_06341 [Burkholderia diffusa]
MLGGRVDLTGKCSDALVYAQEVRPQIRQQLSHGRRQIIGIIRENASGIASEHADAGVDCDAVFEQKAAKLLTRAVRW